MIRNAAHGPTHHLRPHRHDRLRDARRCPTGWRANVDAARKRSRRALLVRVLSGPARRHTASAGSPGARDAHLRQGGRVQRRLACVPGSAAGDLRRAACVGRCRRPVAPRHRRRRGGMAVQRRPSVEHVCGPRGPIQCVVAALGVARAPRGFRPDRHRALRHAAQRRAQSVPAARRRSESHERRLRSAADGVDADPQRRRQLERQHRSHVRDLPRRPGRHGRGRTRARTALRQQRARRRQPAPHRARQREQRLQRHEPESRAGQRQHHQLPAVRFAHALRFPDHPAGDGAESGALDLEQHRSEDPPNWWNLGHRPAKFFDAGMSTDSTRIELSWYMPGAATPQYQEGYDWVLAHEYAGNTWMLSLRSPAYPLPIDTRLAKRGAVLFHRLDLWATRRHNPVPRPVGGNGSCASCHGAYAPRYVNNPRFLATPMLAGMAGNVTPIDIINTDPARMEGNSAAVENAARASFFAYYGQDGCAEKYNLIGYLAQPLYGVWASAPYFHNGSVPTVWGVLKSSSRPLFWRRMSKPAQPGVVMGYETDLARAYDPVALGWRHDELQCG